MDRACSFGSTLGSSQSLAHSSSSQSLLQADLGAPLPLSAASRSGSDSSWMRPRGEAPSLAVAPPAPTAAVSSASMAVAKPAKPKAAAVGSGSVATGRCQPHTHKAQIPAPLVVTPAIESIARRTCPAPPQTSIDTSRSASSALRSVDAARSQSGEVQPHRQPMKPSVVAQRSAAAMSWLSPDHSPRDALPPRRAATHQQKAPASMPSQDSRWMRPRGEAPSFPVAPPAPKATVSSASLAAAKPAKPTAAAVGSGSMAAGRSQQQLHATKRKLFEISTDERPAVTASTSVASAGSGSTPGVGRVASAAKLWEARCAKAPRSAPAPSEVVRRMGGAGRLPDVSGSVHRSREQREQPNDGDRFPSKARSNSGGSLAETEYHRDYHARRAIFEAGA